MLLLIISIVAISNCSSSKNLIENLYKKGNAAELENLFASHQAGTVMRYEKIKENDTIKIVNSIFNSILADEVKDKPSKYFFLQPYWPEIFVDGHKAAINGRFVANFNYGYHKPIMYDFDLVEQIVRFLYRGNQKEGLKRSNQSDYLQRLGFITNSIKLPYTWGNLNVNLIPYKIERISFNSNLTQAEIRYNFVYRGADEIFQFENGKWKKVRTNLQWLE